MSAERLAARLTIDMTVVRDYLDARRTGHAHARELFALAQRGEVDLAIAPQGYRSDVRGELAERLRTVLDSEHVTIARQLAYPSDVTFPSEDLFPGAVVPGFAEAWAEVLATWRSHEGKPPQVADRFHVETHVLVERDVFVTDDRALLLMCRRLADEHGIPVVATTPGEFLTERAQASKERAHAPSEGRSREGDEGESLEGR